MVTRLGCSRWVVGPSLSLKISHMFHKRIIDRLSSLPLISVVKREGDDTFGTLKRH